jgi:hypothetical protein
MEFKNQYQKEAYEKVVKLFQDLNSFSKDEFEIERPGYDFDQVCVKLKGDYPIYVKPQDYHGKYSFFLRHKLPYVDCYSSGRYEAKIIQPKQVGVLAKKKIDDWINYYKGVYDFLLIESRKNVNEVNVFIEEMKQQHAVMNLETSWKKEQVGRGYLLKGGVEFSFEITNTGYISKKIEIHYAVKDTLENFLLISNNDFH